MSELNREQIINALEWCIQSESCEYCEYHDESNGDVCSIRSDALALVNELTEENENLKKSYAVYEECTGLKQVRADTVRKMQAKVKERLRDMAKLDDNFYVLGKSFFDKIANEMLNEKGDNGGKIDHLTEKGGAK